ncbi:sugar phosphate isomerase/epimerase [Halorubrum sp. 48-1-W]|uniref:sugar phosphate isomerase/epimerase family protein n=1 Tax=Halorubrum sp. 48-1-W TaxID=2249761 RepID=UPI000DCBE0B9|nr:sugar phosphate isomerase/epimerase [Halorubrum sp. 48-1-W]RAW46463.1 sugar phosphate isomerase/epimerase [Halorubrum sp. 48-1-W]
MTRLAFSTNAYTEYDLPEAIGRIADHGYAGVELLGDDPHAYFPRFGTADRNAVREALEGTGLAVSNVNANTATGFYDDAPPSAFFEPSLSTADGDDRRWRIEYTKRAIDLADLVGAPAVCVASGTALPGTRPEEAYEYFVDSLHEILDYAEPRGIEVGIEFEPELLVENVEETLTLLDDVGRDGLGVNLDLGHVAVYGDDPVDAIHRCAGVITGVHLEDIAGGIRGKHYHLVPGEGDLSFAPMFDAFDDIEYDGFVTMELYTYPQRPDHAAREAYEALARFV